MDNVLLKLGDILFFQQEEIKRILHQSPSGLFIRILEEFSAIFIYYIGNSPSIYFLSMIAVFLATNTNLMLGILCASVYLGKNVNFMNNCETELFDLISNNVVDIMKTVELYDIIKEVIIDHKVDVIQVQLDGLNYLIHICNSICLVPDKYGNLIYRATNYWKSEENTKHVLIVLPKNFSKSCIKHLGKSGLATLTHNECDEIVSFRINLDYFHPKNIFRHGSMSMITFHLAKQ